MCSKERAEAGGSAELSVERERKTESPNSSDLDETMPYEVELDGSQELAQANTDQSVWEEFLPFVMEDEESLLDPLFGTFSVGPQNETESPRSSDLDETIPYEISLDESQGPAHMNGDQSAREDCPPFIMKEEGSLVNPLCGNSSWGKTGESKEPGGEGITEHEAETAKSRSGRMRKRPKWHHDYWTD